MHTEHKSSNQSVHGFTKESKCHPAEKMRVAMISQPNCNPATKLCLFNDVYD